MARKKKTPADIIEEEQQEKSDAELDSIFSEKEIEPEYYEAVDEAVKELDTWEKRTFKDKGALGPIPRWFPRNDVERLSTNRERLLAQWFSLKKIREMMKLYREHKTDGTPLTQFHPKNANNPTDREPFPQETYGPISVVCHYDDAISAGPDEGLKIMVGDRVAKAILEKNARFERSKGGHAEIQNQKQKRKDEILEFLTQVNSSRTGKVSASQLIKKAAEHFDGRKGFSESSIRRVWNKDFKKFK